jgi:phosphatidylserine/phosphatidylglycerophosphate/cardiolipin synthase-like enzyme
VLEEVVGRVDAVAGGAVERLVRAHHHRRLARAGRLAQLEGEPEGESWARGGTPPRERTSIGVLVDGADALAAIAEAIEGARRHVHVAGWHVSPEFGLTRDRHARRLRDLLGELAERVPVRVLLWAGAPLPAFKPTRAQMRAVREELERGTGVRCALDARERPLHCHHEKLVLVDDEVAFVGGIDLTSLAGDRWDTSEHPIRGRLGWHDASSRLEGPAVLDVARHFAQRWSEITGERIEPSAATAEQPEGRMVQVLRTVPERVYGFAPRGEFSILEAYTRALRSAQRFVYLESQFLWSPEIVAILAGKLREPPTESFRLLVLLPARPNNGADATRGQLGVLAAADQGQGRFLAATVIARSGSVSSPLYVHAKIGIVDDRWLTIGSANLNDHSLFNDTEVNVLTCDPALARDTRRRLWSEHLELPLERVGGEPAQVVDELWRPIAAEQLARRRRGEPHTHRLLELPGVSRRSRALLGPLDGLLVDG